jgi:hypothetical protein
VRPSSADSFTSASAVRLYYRTLALLIWLGCAMVVGGAFSRIRASRRGARPRPPGAAPPPWRGPRALPVLLADRISANRHGSNCRAGRRPSAHVWTWRIGLPARGRELLYLGADLMERTASVLSDVLSERKIITSRGASSIPALVSTWDLRDEGNATVR